MWRFVGALALLLNVSLSIAASPDLQTRYDRIRRFSSAHGTGGLAVLSQAYDVLQLGDYKLVGLEDLWATALKEGRPLFASNHLWGATTATQTGDMLGQTTIGPWQITIANTKELGAGYGIQPDWNDAQIISFLKLRPRLQARLAADFIEKSYGELGLRAPQAIQRYFWLDGFQQKKIGQGPWYASVLAKNPGEMPQTGFYAKQLLLGSRFNPEGLLYWLYRSGDEDSVRSALKVWRESGFEITIEDLEHCACDQTFRDWLRALLSGR